MKGSGKLISIPFDAFVDVFNRIILQAQTDGERAIINRLLDSLTELNKQTQ
jgi:hypothetical protein